MWSRRATPFRDRRMTFSIVACDLEVSPPEWGVAVASKFLAVGSAVPFARAGVGAIATQALANLSYGPSGLELLASGRSAQETVDALIGSDEGREDRQLGVVDAEGRAATFTGRSCFEWAGGVTGKGYCCQGNILVGQPVVTAMQEAFEDASGELAQRLLIALQAGDAAGGDRRGRQSAALLIVSDKGGYGGGSDVAVDLRVDDHPEPVPELERLFGLHRLLIPRPENLEFLDVEPLIGELRDLLDVPGGPVYDAPLRSALQAFVGTENLEERWTDDERVERGVLEHLRLKKGVSTSS